MSRIIASLTVIAMFAADGAVRAEHAGHHHDVGHHHHGFDNDSGGHHGGGDLVGVNHHHGGGYGYLGGQPFAMPAMVQPAWNPRVVWLQSVQAAVQCEQARKLNIQNMALVEQQCRQRKEARIQFHSARHDAELQRRLARQRQAAPREKMRDQRSAGVVVSVSADGTINWPNLLRDDRYKAQRDQLDAILARAVAEDFVGRDRDDARQVKTNCEELLTKLTAHARDANSNDWIEAKRFVDRLAVEGCRPSAGGRLAGR